MEWHEPLSAAKVYEQNATANEAVSRTKVRSDSSQVKSESEMFPGLERLAF